MRTDRYRYTEWQKRDTGEVLAVELYDHKEDALENVNRAADPAYAAPLEALSAQLRLGWQGVEVQ